MASYLGSPSFPSPLDRIRGLKRSPASGNVFTGDESGSLSFSSPLVGDNVSLDSSLRSLSQSLNRSWALYQFAGSRDVPLCVRNPNKAVMCIDARSTEVLTCNRLAEELFGRSDLAGLRLGALIKARKGCAVLNEDLLPVDGERVVLVNGKLVQLPDGKLVSLWMRKLDAGRCLCLLESVESVHARLECDERSLVMNSDDASRHLFGNSLSGDVRQLVPGLKLGVEGERPLIGVSAGRPFPLLASCAPLSAGGWEVCLTVFVTLSGMVTATETGNIVSCNEHLARLFLGREQADVVGAPLQTVLPQWEADLDETDELLEDADRLLAESGMLADLSPDESAGDDERREGIVCSTPSKRVPQLRDGTFCTQCLHGDGHRFPVVIQVKRVEPSGLFCLWMFRDPRLVLSPAEQETAGLDEPRPTFSLEYEPLQQIGRGAYGFVRLARRKTDGRELVVKYIRRKKVLDECWADDPRLGRVPKECLLLGRLSHPGIVCMVDLLRDEDFFFLVMEKHGQGMDLFEFIDRRPLLDEPLCAAMFAQLAKAVQYLHASGVAHRDIKDENVIVDTRFAVKLIDFGSAAFFDPSSLFSTFCGTVEYCAPEVLQGNKYRGPELDVWALGVTLYTVVFGENPFFDAEEAIRAELCPPRSVSSPLFLLLDGMLQKSARYRWEDVLPHADFVGNTAADDRPESDEELALELQKRVDLRKSC